jgi:SH3-like domain-containing protein
MIELNAPLPPARRLLRREEAAVLRALLLIALLLLVGLGATLAMAAEAPSGLPLPRFATTRSTPINVRVGPGTKYGIAWVYVKAGTPVEIVQEFDTWRKIRDFDGSEGWVHQNLLSGKRAGLAAPWRSDAQIPLLAGRNPDGGVRAYLGAGFRVDIDKCDGAWCEVSATTAQAGGGASTYSGYLPQTDLWGVYQGESFD